MHYHYTLSRKHITVGEIKNNQLILNPKRFYIFGTQMCNIKNIYETKINQRRYVAMGRYSHKLIFNPCANTLNKIKNSLIFFYICINICMMNF